MQRGYGVGVVEGGTRNWQELLIIEDYAKEAAMENGDRIEGQIAKLESTMQSKDNSDNANLDEGKKLLSAYELAYVKYPDEEASAESPNINEDHVATAGTSLQDAAPHAKEPAKHDKRLVKITERAQNRALAEERNKTERDRIWARIAAYDYNTLVREYEIYYRGNGQGYYYESREAKSRKMELKLLYGISSIITLVSAITCGYLFLIACFMDLIGKNVPFFKYYFPFLVGCLVMTCCYVFLLAKLDDLERDLIDRGYEITEVNTNTIFAMLDEKFKKTYPAQYDGFIRWIKQQLVLEKQRLANENLRLANENLSQINKDMNDRFGELNESVASIRRKLPWWWW